MPEGFFEQVTADKSQLGFDYQDLVCLEHLISMKPGETVGLEVFDDIHHERVSGTNTLIQVKHSVNDAATLTNRDIDLWKTLYNWSSALDHLGTNDIEFIFFTNKQKTNQNGIVQLLALGKPNISALIKVISEIKIDIDTKEKTKANGATENPIKKYVDHIHDINNVKKEILFSRINMIFSDKGIFERLAKKVEYFAINKAESLDVVSLLIGAYRKQKYELIKSGQKIIIDYETFRHNFQFNRIIKITADRKVDFSRYHQFKNVNTIDPRDGLFSKQLADIDIPQKEITEHAIEYAATSMFIQKLIVDGDFSESENNAIDSEIFYAWRSLHKRLYNQSEIDTDNDHKCVARDCFYKIEDIPIHVANSQLSRPMVVGKGIELSDTHRIGWRKNWHDLYGPNK